MSALVHERTPLLCALGGAAAGEKHSVCQSDGSPGLGQRGAESREGDRYVPTRHESRPARSSSLLCVRKEKLNNSPVPGAFANTRASHQMRIRTRSLAWGTAKEMGLISRHWAHRDQTWSCAVFLRTREGASLSLWHTEPVEYYEMAPGTVFKCTVVIRAPRCTGLGSELDAPGKTYGQANMWNGKMRRNRLCIGPKRFFFFSPPKRFPLTAVYRQS